MCNLDIKFLMSIYIWPNEISSLKKGTSDVSEVYVWDTKVRPTSVPWIWSNIEINSTFNPVRWNDIWFYMYKDDTLTDYIFRYWNQYQRENAKPLMNNPPNWAAGPRITATSNLFFNVSYNFSTWSWSYSRTWWSANFNWRMSSDEWYLTIASNSYTLTNFVIKTESFEKSYTNAAQFNEDFETKSWNAATWTSNITLNWTYLFKYHFWS